MACRRTSRCRAPTPESLQPPLVLRLALWAIALPLGSLIVFALARWFGVLTKAQLEDTILLTGWGRFVPVARLLPFCALATALIVQLGVFGLERLRARNLRPRASLRGGGRVRTPGPGPGPRRPMRPPGQGQRDQRRPIARPRHLVGRHDRQHRGVRARGLLEAQRGRGAWRDGAR